MYLVISQLLESFVKSCYLSVYTLLCSWLFQKKTQKTGGASCEHTFLKTYLELFCVFLTPANSGYKKASLQETPQICLHHLKILRRKTKIPKIPRYRYEPKLVVILCVLVPF